MESDRLWYRGLEPSDAELLRGWINDERVRKYLDHRVFPLNRAAEEDFVRRVCQVSAAPSEVSFLFGVHGEGAPIGNVGLIGSQWVAREAELGILVGAVDRWHHGFAREASRRMLRYAFDDLNLNRVKLRVSDANPRARRAYEAIGFVLEGTLREAAFIDGTYVDTHVMSVLRREHLAGVDGSP